ncbi:PD-(D/E)XK motif protein [Pseudolysinimonas yzui]|uniref:PD-(D/E)XK motif protein n=1 Tax=Pseudolysinimonas yzui TaxID=2708254 RepID=UPI001E63DA15|nr:PD-(D/E)XK motif protein [Pseudolysinimonas yzui]
MSLRTSYEQPEPDLARLSNVAFTTRVDGERDLAVISIHVDRSVQLAYGLLTEIADAVQLRNLALAAACSASVDRYRSVLSQRMSLSMHAEVGLFGELLVVEHLINTVGAEAAIGAWQGPLSEEHDFAFGDTHIEVKTTSTERREHVIAGLDQLVPVGEVPLLLLSVQITRASVETGSTLPGLVGRVRAAAAGHNTGLDERLSAAGWLIDDTDLYPTYWALRSAPRAYRVDEQFPAITTDRLGAVVPNFGLVSDVEYRVDVTALDHVELPSKLRGFGQTAQGEIQ